MVLWQYLLREGNKYFKQDELFVAEELYHQAFHILNVDLHRNPNDIMLIQALICTHHNLATTYEQQAKLHDAAHYIYQAHSFAMSCANNHCLSEQTQSFALRMTSITYQSILELQKKYPNCEICDQKAGSLNTFPTNDYLH